jgi:hypothetical protein
LLRLHVKLSEDDNATRNIAESAEILAAHFSLIAKAIHMAPAATAYILIAASCGSEHVFARSIQMPTEFLTLITALSCSLVVSVVPSP